MTYSSLSSEVCGYLQIDTSDIAKFQVQNTLNRSQTFLLNILPQKYLTEFIKTVKGDLDDDQPLYQLPADFIRLLVHEDDGMCSLWIDYDGYITQSNEGYQCRLVDEQSLLINNINNPYSQTRPKVSLGTEGGFEIRPIPTVAVTHGWRMRYIYKLPNISSGQNCMLRVNLRNLLVFKATSLSAAVEGSHLELTKEFENHFEKELQLFIPKREKGKNES